MSEIARHYELIDDDPDFRMKAGDILACTPYAYDRGKLAVAFRVSDLYDPSCTVYREQVRRVDGETEIQWRDKPPYGAKPVQS